MSKCVLHHIIDEYNVGIARNIEAEFGVPPVSFVTWEFNEKELGLTPSEMEAVGIKYSLPRFYYENIESIRALSYEELDELQLSLEEGLNVRGNTMVASYERAFQNIEDYRTCRNMQVVNLMFADLILRENDPLFFFSARECYLWNIIADACLSRGVPAFATPPTRDKQRRRVGLDAFGQQLGMEEAFNALQQGDTGGLDKELIQAGDAWYDAFVQKQPTPWGTIGGQRTFLRCVKDALTAGCKSLVRNQQLYEENEFDREMGMLEPSVASLVRWPMKAGRFAALEWGSVLDKAPDMNKKFVYLPLHHSPEVTDLYYGRDYCHHEGFVHHVAKRLPSEYCLYVKEHVGMLGLRPVSFYRNLKKTYNIEVIHPGVSTFDLIRNSGGVITPTSTAGWEAFHMGKPVITLGEVFYNFLPNILYINLFASDAGVRIARYLREFQHDETICRNAARADFLSSYVIESPGPVKSLPPVEYGKRLMPFVKTVYAKWRERMISDWREARKREGFE